MNNCLFIGRLTKDPEVRVSQSGKSMARFNLAIDRNTKDKVVDYPTMVAFDKTAELIEKYCYKGMLVGIMARAITGSYEKDGKKVYTTEFAVDRIEFLSKKQAETPAQEIPEGFAMITDDDIPF